MISFESDEDTVTPQAVGTGGGGAIEGKRKVTKRKKTKLKTLQRALYEPV